MPLRNYHEDEPMVLSSVLLLELHHQWCRQRIELDPIDVDLPVGAVLAKTSSGAVTAYLKAAEADKAFAMLVTPVKASDKKQTVVGVVRGAVVSAANLHFLEAVTEAQKKTALEQLAALGIVPEEID